MISLHPTSTGSSAPLVLIIEDEPGDARLIQWQLLDSEAAAFRVHWADSLSAAERLIDQEGLQPDVVLLDLNLPDSTGVATVERCRSLIEDAPLVVLTGFDDQAATQAAIEAGAEDFLAKGADGAILRRAIRYAILRHQRDAVARLATTVFRHAREGILIAAANGTIIDINETFTHITGYRREEAIGRNPRFLQSGIHDREFYVKLWHDLKEQGHWYGEIWDRRKNGELCAVSYTLSTVRDARNHIRHYVGLFSDITVQKEHEQELEYIAHYDTLTKLPNRALLADRLHQAMAQVQRRNQRLAVVYLDLDGFKTVNDTHGHDVGDHLLVTVATRMKQALREGDTIARLGGDEFVAVLIDLPDINACEPLLTRLLAAAAQPVHLGGFSLQVSASLGVTLYPQPRETDADQLLRQADQAMYQAKLSGKNRYQLFDPAQDRRIQTRHQILKRLRQAMHQDEFALHYQPKVHLRQGTIIGAEALIRWRHPERGLLLPGAFLPAISGQPLAQELDRWVIRQALKQLSHWQTIGLNLSISVNVSAYPLKHPNFLDHLRELLDAHPGLPPASLILEVQETSTLDDFIQAETIMRACQEFGIRFALDDFGAGQTSMFYLKRLPATELKIDQSFVQGMLHDPDDLAIVQSIIGLGAAFRRQVIAEGMETREHGYLLLRLGCELAQGYGIAHPMPADDFPEWVAQWRPDPLWSSLQPCHRDQLPLLTAAVEHSGWVEHIRAHITQDQVEFLAVPGLNPCRFMCWMQESSQILQDHPQAETILRLHQQVHEQGERILALRHQGKQNTALHQLPELLRLRDSLLEALWRC